MSVDHQPRNGLEEMIQWTKEGKLWQYPINNEDGDCYTVLRVLFLLDKDQATDLHCPLAPFQASRRKLASLSMNMSS